MQAQCRLFVASDVRIQVRSGRWRVPDLIIFADELPADRYPPTPPAGVVEILSPDDSLDSLITKLDEYREFGVPHTWVVDPEHRRVYKHESGDLIQVNAIEFPERGFLLDASEIFG